MQVRFADARALATHLGQLEHLSITDSYHFQIPYLLRSVIPDGLSTLKSLEVHQNPYYCLPIHDEGALWYETEDGEFLQETTLGKPRKRIDSSYVQSIARGAPNIREFYLDGLPYRDRESIVSFKEIPAFSNTRLSFGNRKKFLPL